MQKNGLNEKIRFLIHNLQPYLIDILCEFITLAPTLLVANVARCKLHPFRQTKIHF